MDRSKRKADRKAKVFERRLRDQGVEIVDGGFDLDAPDAALIALYHTAREQHGKHGRKGMQSRYAAELVRRGALGGCGCKGCTEIYADGQAWEVHCKREGVDPRT